MNRAYYQFVLRKLHSLSGLLLIGVFLIFHLTSPGVNIFNAGFLPALLFFSLPLIFHTIYGLYIIYQGSVRLDYHHGNLQYLLQRITAVVILFFVPVHIYVMKCQSELIYHPHYLTFWIIGIIATVFHLCNGIFGFSIHFGIVVGDKSQKTFSVLAFLLFLLMTVVGLNALAELTGSLAFIMPVYKFLFS